ncbi:hypothetical protein [Desulfopila aestuarii]|uniref:Uncharacterized protein n=1 Tax=Desulfopila aestuarii DSM 18488 TaxID=1121416 RepID=A0A1M7Y1N6_9BACT|nr:hypothetical protein [Desulfopila aestuarii]SHO45737.1 hypothetical protein SAMN02745220_01192 [Desulfopila aestuarii DSM 18488]
MIRTIILIVFFFIMSVVNISLVNPVKQIQGKYIQESYTRIGILPTSLLQAICLEFQGVVADLLFLKTLTFMGYKIDQNTSPEPEDWQSIYNVLDKITDLDPSFLDPYVFAEMILTWQAGMTEQVDNLLHKATIGRPNDYRPHFYLGFNAFYFRNLASEAAPHLRKASVLPDAPKYLAGLASRMSLYGSQTVLGILFLEELIAETYDPLTKQQLKTRLDALKQIYLLEQAVNQYKTETGVFPKNLTDLVDRHYIERIPSDPYGGEFVILSGGKIYTTSNLLPQGKKN